MDLHLGPTMYAFGFVPLLNWLTTDYKCFKLVGTDGAMLFLRLGPLTFSVTREETPPHWRSVLEPVDIPRPEPTRQAVTHG